MSERSEPSDAERLDPDLTARLERYGAGLDRAAADAQLARAAREPVGDAPAGDPGIVELASRRRRAWPVVATAAASVIIVAGAIGVLLANGDGEPVADRDLAAAQSAVPTAAATSPDTSAAIVSAPATVAVTTVAVTTVPAVTTTVVVPLGPPPLGVESTTTVVASSSGRRPVCPDYTHRVDYSLRLCDKGPAVLIIQDRLVAAGAGIAIDGYFGPGTQNAVRQFQREQGLDVDGWVGPDTWSRLVPDAPGVDLNGSGLVDPNELIG